MKSPVRSGWRPRRTYIVKPRYQIQFAAVLVLLQLNLGILYLGILSHRYRELAESAGSVELLLALNFWKASLPVMAIASILAAIAVVWIGLHYSNHIVGPVPRMVGAMRELARGNTQQRLAFRPGDALGELAGEFNALCAALEEAGYPAHATQSRGAEEEGERATSTSPPAPEPTEESVGPYIF